MNGGDYLDLSFREFYLSEARRTRGNPPHTGLSSFELIGLRLLSLEDRFSVCFF
jgi:hypothetical protein